MTDSAFDAAVEKYVHTWKVGERVERGESAENYLAGLVVGSDFRWDAGLGVSETWITVAWSNGTSSSVEPDKLRALGSRPF